MAAMHITTQAALGRPVPAMLQPDLAAYIEV